MLLYASLHLPCYDAVQQGEPDLDIPDPCVPGWGSDEVLWAYSAALVEGKEKSIWCLGSLVREQSLHGALSSAQPRWPKRKKWLIY